MSDFDQDQINKDMLTALMSEKPFDPSLKVETEPPKAEEQAQAEQQAEEQQGAPTDAPPTEEKTETPKVLAKDGVHTIPYSVVEGLRNRVAELSQRIADVEAAKAANVQAPQHEDIPQLSEEDMELLREEFPDVVKRMEAMDAKIARLNELETKVVEHERKEKLTAAQQAQDAIDSIPKLAHIQENDARLFAKACEFDKQLQTDPDMAALPLADRFAKALAAVEALYGEITIPDEAAGAEAPGPATQTPPATSTAKSSNGKQNKVQQATKTALPNTLSDLPTGSPPVHDPLAALASLSTQSQLGHFIGKTPDEIHAELNRIL